MEHRNIWKKLCLLGVMASFASGAVGQNDVAFKTNLVGDATLSPSLGIEIGLATHWSLDLSGEYNGWAVKDMKWKHWLAQPEMRFWFCDRFAGHFIGLHALGGEYNFGNIRNSVQFLGNDFSILSDKRVQGWAAGGGLAYGYSWLLGRHWNLEAEVGVGYAYTRYDVFECVKCGKVVSTDNERHYIGPTKAALNLVFSF